jgi:hypothetical protein
MLYIIPEYRYYSFQNVDYMCCKLHGISTENGKIATLDLSKANSHILTLINLFSNYPVFSVF